MALSDCIVPEVRETIDPTLSAGAVTFTGITLTEGGLKIPAIQATWLPISNPYVTRVQIRYQEVGLASGMIPTASVQKESLSWLSTMGIVGGKSYIVQQRAVSDNAYGLWSTPATVPVPAAFVAGDTTHVDGVPAVDVVTGLSTNAAELAKQILLDQNFRSYQEALNYDGDGNSTQFIALSSVEQSQTAIQLLSLLGAVTSDNSAFVLNSTTAMADSTTSMGQLLTLINSTLGDGSITVSMLAEAIDGQAGRIALSVNSVGQVVGVDLGIDGETAHFDMVSPNFRFIDPLGVGGPLTVLSYSSARARWEFTADVYAQKFFADSIYTDHLVDNSVSQSIPSYTNTPMSSVANGTTLLSVTITPVRTNGVKIIFTGLFHFPSSRTNLTCVLYRNGSPLVSGAAATFTTSFDGQDQVSQPLVFLDQSAVPGVTYIYEVVKTAGTSIDFLSGSAFAEELKA